MNKELVIKKLLSLDYNEQQAMQVADDLFDIDNSLTQLLSDWVSDSIETEIEICGFSLIELKNMYQMTYPAALLTMDWLIKDPQNAMKSLRKGIK